MPTKWSDLRHEGAHLRNIHNRLFKRIKKYDGNGDDEMLLKTVEKMCTLTNTQHKLVSNIRYEQRLEDIEAILQHIPVEQIVEAKRKAGI